MRSRTSPDKAFSACVALVLAVLLVRVAAQSGRQLTRLIEVASRIDGAHLVVAIETSEPAAYTTSQPDPLTVLIDLRNTATDGATSVPAMGQATGPVASIRIESAKAPDGVALARVRIALNAPVRHRVRSSRSSIFVELERDGSEAQPRRVPPIEASEGVVPRIDPPPSGSSTTGTPAPVQSVALATALTSIRTEWTAAGPTVILRGNGRLAPSQIDAAADPPPRLVLDFPELSMKVPGLTAVSRPPIDRIRVAENSRAPRMTRVVIDLTEQVSYRILDPDDQDVRELHIVLEPAFQDDLLAASIKPVSLDRPSDTPVRPAAVGSGGSTIVDPMSALRAVPAGVSAASPDTPSAPATAASIFAGVSPNPAVSTPPTAALATQPVGPAGLYPAVERERATNVATISLSAETAQNAFTQTQTAVPPAPPEPPAPPPAQAGTQPVQTTTERQYTGNPVSLDFQSADLRSVLRTFAEISGLNIVIDPAVQGVVDVRLTDVPWDQALDTILRANKLGYTVEGTIVRIAPLTVLAEEETQRRKLSEEQALAGQLRVLTRTLSYAKANELKPLLTSTVLSQRGQVQVDPRTNTLIITDLQPRLEAAAQLLDTLDRAEPQVEIEARVVQTSREFARSIGVQWGLAGRVAPELGNTTGLAFPNRGSVTGRTGGTQGGLPGGDPRSSAFENIGTAVNLPASNATSAIGLALGAVNGALNLDVALSALERTGKGRILSTPRVSTQNNVEAEMYQGVQIPIQTIANNTVTVTFKDAALTLRVTPQITTANTVIMKIILENATPDYSRQVNGIPPIDTQRANTQVQVGDGATTVIGGIMVSREQSSVDKVPGLQRIPLLGWLFKRDAIQDESRELLIFITPRIIRG